MNESHDEERDIPSRISDMQEQINSINRACEDLTGEFNSITTSTAPIIQGRRYRVDVTTEVIDLSNFELARPATIRRTNTSNAAIVDLDDPTPPKRSCPGLEQSQEEEPYRCPVCLENVRRREPVSTKCGHVYCKECLVAAINSVHKCPLCNKKLSRRQFSRIYL